MKRMICLSVSLMVLTVFLSGCHWEDSGADSTADSSTAVTTAVTTAESTAEITTEASPETSDITDLSVRLIREIDGALEEENKLPESSTTLGMIQLFDKYAEKWSRVAEEYYNKIMEYDGIVQFEENEYSSDDLHTFVSDMKESWEEYYEEQAESYSKVLITIYKRGTVRGPIFADYKLEMNRDWALQLVNIYEALGIE